MRIGEDLQLKCTLTCAKTNVEPNEDIAIPGTVTAEINFNDNIKTIAKENLPSEEEKENVKKLMEIFGL